MDPAGRLIPECKSSLPPGLTYKWDQDALDAFKCNQEDATTGRLLGVKGTVLSGLGLPHHDQPEEVLLWRSSLESDNKHVVLAPEHALIPFMGGEICSQLSDISTREQ